MSPDKDDRQSTSEHRTEDGDSDNESLNRSDTSYLTPSTNAYDHRKWSSTTSIGNISTQAQTDEDEGRSDIHTPTMDSGWNTPVRSEHSFEPEGGLAPVQIMDRDHKESNEKEPHTLRQPGVVTAARTHPLGGKGAHWKGVSLEESYQRELDANPDRQLEIGSEGFQAIPHSNSQANHPSDDTSSNYAGTSTNATSTKVLHGHDAPTDTDSSLVGMSRSSTNATSMIARHGHTASPSTMDENFNFDNGVSRASTMARDGHSLDSGGSVSRAPTNATSTRAHDGHEPLPSPSAFASSDYASTHATSMRAHHGHDVPTSPSAVSASEYEAGVSRASTNATSMRANHGHGDTSSPSPMPSPSSPSTFGWSHIGSHGHPDMNRTDSTTSSVPTSTSSPYTNTTNQFSTTANHGHATDPDAETSSLVSEGTTAHGSTSSSSINTTTSTDDPLRQNDTETSFTHAEHESIPIRPSPSKEISTTADVGHAEPDNEVASLTSSSSSMDSHRSGPSRLMAKVKGEVKVIAGKLSNNEERVEVGRRLMGKV